METRNGKVYVGTVSRSIEIGLRMIGAWPGSSYTIFHRAFWMITLAVAQTFQYRYFIVHIRTDDLSHLMDGLSTTMSYSLLLLKLMIFWSNRRIFHNILRTMAQDRNECATEWAAWSMSKTTYVSYRSSNLIISLYSMSVFLYGTGVLVAQIDDSNEQLVVPTRELFLKMELPFEFNTSPMYEVVMITQFFHQLAAATIVGVLNALIVSLCYWQQLQRRNRLFKIIQKLEGLNDNFELVYIIRINIGLNVACYCVITMLIQNT